MIRFVLVAILISSTAAFGMVHERSNHVPVCANDEESFWTAQLQVAEEATEAVADELAETDWSYQPMAVKGRRKPGHVHRRLVYGSKDAWITGVRFSPRLRERRVYQSTPLGVAVGPETRSRIGKRCPIGSAITRVVSKARNLQAVFCARPENGPGFDDCCEARFSGDQEFWTCPIGHYTAGFVRRGTAGRKQWKALICCRRPQQEAQVEEPKRVAENPPESDATHTQSPETYVTVFALVAPLFFYVLARRTRAWVHKRRARAAPVAEQRDVVTASTELPAGMMDIHVDNGVLRATVPRDDHAKPAALARSQVHRVHPNALPQQVLAFRDFERPMDVAVRVFGHHIPAVEFERELAAHWSVRDCAFVVKLLAFSLPRSIQGGITVTPWGRPLGIHISDLGAVSGAQRDHTARLWILHDLARGVRNIHARGIAHFNLKPENVILYQRVFADGQRQDAEWIAKLADFGSRDQHHIPLSLDNANALAVQFAAPEQLRRGGENKPGPLSDMWALGHLCNFIWSMQRPQDSMGREEAARYFHDVAMGRIRPRVHESVPRKLQVIVERCFAFSPLDRPDATEFARVVNDLLFPLPSVE